MRDRQTIIQLATPAGIGAVHIIRVSGRKSLSFLKRHVRRKTILPGRVYYGSFYRKSKVLDKIVFFYNQKPKSFTGEDLVELQVHGSPLIVKEILEVANEENLFLAKPGEFSERAFLNGKISLEMAEATNSLIHTKSSFIKENALKILEKKANLNFSQIEHSIREMMAQLESSIEFPEEDIPELDKPKLELYKSYEKKLREIITYFERISNNYLVGKKIGDGIKVGIIGLPNVGKSTLFNLLLGEDRAIVSNQKGTTRDYLSESFMLKSYQLNFLDTAGLRETEDQIEKKGIDKTLDIIEETDIVIALVDSTAAVSSLFSPLSDKFIKIKMLREKPVLIYINKIDALSKKEMLDIRSSLEQNNWQAKEDISLGEVSLGEISLKEKPQQARDLLLGDLEKVLDKNFLLRDNDLSLVSHRQFIIVNRLIDKLRRIERGLNDLNEEEILVEELRFLEDDFDELNLNIEREEILSSLFRQFCIGK